MNEHGARIGDAAALYGLAPSTLRWWEEQGVLDPPARRGGQRLYRDHDLRRLGLAYLCRVTGGTSLDRAVVITSGKADLQAWQGAISEQLTELEERIERLRAAHDYLSDLLRCTDHDPALCPHLDENLIRRTPRGRVDEPDLVAAARAAGRGGHHRDEKPSRDVRRDENLAAPTCASCARPIAPPPRGRPRTYCSRACQQRAYRLRNR